MQPKSMEVYRASGEKRKCVSVRRPLKVLTLFLAYHVVVYLLRFYVCVRRVFVVSME